MAALTPEEIKIEEETPQTLQSPYFLWKRHCDVVTLYRNWISDVLKPKIATLLEREGRGNSLRILSVAAGHGEFDVELLRVMNKIYPNVKVHFTVVEPAESSVNQFKANITQLDKTAQDQAEFCWFQLPYSDFLERYHGKAENGEGHSSGALGGQHYDIAILINALDHIGSYPEKIPEIRGLLSPGGCMIAIGATLDSNSAQLAEMTHPDWGGDGAELYAEKIVNFLKESKHTYKFYRYSTDFTVPCVFDGESVYGTRLLNALTFSEAFRDTADAAIVDKVLKRLRAITKKKTMNGIEVDYFREELGFIVIEK